ncbi:hypothetical protein [Hymenobacter sp. BT730]|uniref:hypothetical protein n=1 Tax=Hymenobacter sp. BT730 TaxID=3063332 RepID=UPI0026DFFB21|nr:hypothetical protein [Hymenobacter sp. BT730]
MGRASTDRQVVGLRPLKKAFTSGVCFSIRSDTADLSDLILSLSLPLTHLNQER